MNSSWTICLSCLPAKSWSFNTERNTHDRFVKLHTYLTFYINHVLWLLHYIHCTILGLALIGGGIMYCSAMLRKLVYSTVLLRMQTTRRLRSYHYLIVFYFNSDFFGRKTVEAFDRRDIFSSCRRNKRITRMSLQVLLHQDNKHF